MDEELERRRAAVGGVVARMSEGGWGHYHRADCAQAPHRGDAGVRHVIRGPWRYLAAHWTPCPICRPPAPLHAAPAEATAA